MSGKLLSVWTATSSSLVMSDSRRRITTRRKYLGGGERGVAKDCNMKWHSLEAKTTTLGALLHKSWLDCINIIIKTLSLFVPAKIKLRLQ